MKIDVWNYICDNPLIFKVNPSKTICGVCITLLVIGTLFGSMIGSGYDVDNLGLNESEINELQEIIDEKLREATVLKNEEEYIEVIIRLSPKEVDNEVLEKSHCSEVMSTLKEHSKREQAGIVELVESNDGRVLNTFWIANAILAEIRVGTLNTITTWENVWKVHENFEVSMLESTRTLPQHNDGVPSTDDNHNENTQANESCLIPHLSTNGVYQDIDLTWGLERINVTGLWDKGIDGTGIRVAVSDTGVDMSHPDLMGKMVNVEDDGYYTGGWIHFDGDGNIVEDSVPHDDHGHGTHCSGTVLGGSHSGTHIGVAPGAELMHALVLPRGGGTVSQVYAGMEWKAEPFDRHGNILEPIEEHRAHVASMSWGASGYHEYLKEPILNLKNSGVVPVAGMGNDGDGNIVSPGAIYESFGIGASDVNDDIADFSSGAIIEDGRDDTPKEYVKPDFSAPGLDVFSAVPGGDWDYHNGTSMAAPHVAGTVALMLDSYTSVDDVYEALAGTADYYEAGDDLGGMQNTRYGHGIIDAGKAVEAVSTIRLTEPTGINRTHATLQAEVFNIPKDEAEVYFRYREEGTDDWSFTDPVTVYEPKVMEAEIDSLEKGTTYEYGAVLEWEGQQRSTFTHVFRTHRDVEVITKYPENLLSNSTILWGEVTHLYVEEAEVSFEYRSDGEEVWERVVIENVTKPTEFSYELSNLNPYIYYRYRGVAETMGEEFTGSIVQYMVSSPEPEWDEEKKSYLITDLAELQWMKNDLGSNYTLADDIDAADSRLFFGGKGFEPIGVAVSFWLDSPDSFHGLFDGCNHTISGLFINRSHTNYVGLFGAISQEGIVKNVGLIDVNVSGYDFVGGVVGLNRGLLTNTYNTGIVNGEYYIGGLVGWNEYGTVSNSYVTATVSGDNQVGGLVGRNGATVSNSYVTGTVRGRFYVGGLVGENFYGCTVENSYASVNVNGFSSVGGLVGLNRGKVTNSCSMGNVNGDIRVGGLIGFRGAVSNSFWDIETSGQSVSTGGEGKTTAEMMDITTFSEAGWDITAVDSKSDRETDSTWNIVDSQTYPFFSWEGFTLEVYTIGNGTIDYQPQGHTYADGEEVTIITEPDEHWHFCHWTGDVPEGEEYSEEITVVMDKDKEITAHFEIKKYTLGVETHGDGSVYIVSEQDHYEHGTEVEIDAHPDEGWYFSHWSGDVPEGEEYNEDITVFMDDDKTLTAHFEMREFSLNIIVEGDGTTVPSIGDHTYIYEDEVNVTASAADGWYFSHWSGDVPEGVEYNENITIFMDDNKTLTAHFDEIIPPTVNITSFDDGEVFDNDEVTVEWEAVEGTYSIDRYELRLNDGEWIDVGTDTRYTFEGLEDGEYNVTVRVVDSEGNYGECSLEFTVERPLLTSNWWFYLIGAVVAVSILLILWQKDYLKQTTLDEEDHEEEDTDS